MGSESVLVSEMRIVKITPTSFLGIASLGGLADLAVQSFVLSSRGVKVRGTTPSARRNMAEKALGLS